LAYAVTTAPYADPVASRDLVDVLDLISRMPLAASVVEVDALWELLQNRTYEPFSRS
jgi:hypothetical protein